MEKVDLTIKETTDLTGFSAHTLRYYEREGLIDVVNRSQSGHRRYSRRDLAWIEFLGRLRDTGMPIRKMKHFATLRREGEPTISARLRLLEEHQIEVRKHLAKLERDLTTIVEKIEIYSEMEVMNGTNKE